MRTALRAYVGLGGLLASVLMVNADVGLATTLVLTTFLASYALQSGAVSHQPV